MAQEFILVDFENVQPSSLGALRPGDCHIRLFAGEHQKKVDIGLVQALQQFGKHAEYIQIVGNGKDALDFHIAFYIGRLSAGHPGASFTIVSRDTGFDPLVKHLAGLGIACRRIAAIAGATAAKPARAGTAASKPTAKAATKAAAPKKAAVKSAPRAVAKPEPRALAAPASARLDEVLERLEGLKAARPGTIKTLRSSLKAWFKPPPTEAEADALLDRLKALGRITVIGNKLGYPARAK
ncbi:MAG TPA: PIN domain-containing protein [Patescibacteria group bacterium]|nr:PIN domain-containing protein [Patescibacteria group bacterium]